LKVDDRDQLLDAIESDPADDAFWLVLADWLEERGDPLAAEIRDVIAAGLSNTPMNHWRKMHVGLCRTLPTRTTHGIACDCIERVLPMYEAEYPDDRAPRQFLEVFRLVKPGRRLDAARRAVNASFTVFNQKHPYRMSESSVSRRFLDWLLYVENSPGSAYYLFSHLMAQARFGPKYRPHSSSFTQRFKLLEDVEYRWLVARTLRYHSLGKTPT
jgi:uncharacterized protein (TIGR02996 family)